MASVEWTQRSKDDLEDILVYIGREQQSPAAATKVLDRILEKLRVYSTNNLPGTLRSDFGPDIRIFQVHRYVIAYRPSDEGIVVLRVFHGAQDVLDVFGN